MPFKKPDFTIDDAFSESAEDKIRLYTRTSESVPLTEETIQVHLDLSILEDECMLKLGIVPFFIFNSCHCTRRSQPDFLTLEVLRVIQRQFLSAALPAQPHPSSRPKPFRILPFRYTYNNNRSSGAQKNSFMSHSVLYNVLSSLSQHRH